jgi:hypothetical protein
MTLLLPAPPAFGYFVTNEDSPSGGAYGASVAASGSTNTKGTWVAIHATISYDLYVHTITLTEGNVSTQSTRIFVDLGIGPDASNVTVVAENLEGSNAAPHTQGGRVYHAFPLYIPSGTQLWARSQSNIASQTVRVHVASWGAPDHPESFPKISFIESIGEVLTSTTSAGMTPGASGTLGGLSNMGTASNDICALSMGVGSQDASLTAVAYLGAVATTAAAQTQELGICTDHKNLSTVEAVRSNSTVVWCDVAAGVELDARLSCTGTADSSMTGVLYGFVRG